MITNFDSHFDFIKMFLKSCQLTSYAIILGQRTFIFTIKLIFTENK